MSENSPPAGPYISERKSRERESRRTRIRADELFRLARISCLSRLSWSQEEPRKTRKTRKRNGKYRDIDQGTSPCQPRPKRKNENCHRYTRMNTDANVHFVSVLL